MPDAEAELDARGWLTGPKLWLRYNPDSFRIGTFNCCPPRFQRERWLRDVLTRLVLTPDTPPMILYSFYPVPSVTSVLPKVAFKANYPGELLDRVRCHIDPKVPPACLEPWLTPATTPSPDTDEVDEDADEGSEADDELADSESGSDEE